MTAVPTKERKNKKARILVESGPLERVDRRSAYTSSIPGVGRYSRPFIRGWMNVAQTNASCPKWARLVVNAGVVITIGSLG